MQGYDYVKEWRRKNHEKHLEQRRRWRAKNKERLAEKARQYYLDNPNKRQAKDKKYYLSHRDQARAKNSKYRARVLENGHSPYDPLEIFERDNWICHICHALVEWEERSIDHIIPVSLGGSDTPDNVALAHLKCNIRKGNRIQKEED